jgi:hypothetical protein
MDGNNMMYKLENGVLLSANIAYTPEGENVGWYEFENETEALKYFLNSVYNATAVYENEIDEARALKCAELQAAYDNWKQQGWTDSISGLTLFLGEQDKIHYTQLKSIAFDEPDGTLIPIGTFTGWHTIEKTVLYDMLVRYGRDGMAAYKKLSDLQIYVNYVCQTLQDISGVKW